MSRARLACHSVFSRDILLRIVVEYVPRHFATHVERVHRNFDMSISRDTVPLASLHNQPFAHSPLSVVHVLPFAPSNTSRGLPAGRLVGLPSPVPGGCSCPKSQALALARSLLARKERTVAARRSRSAGLLSSSSAPAVPAIWMTTCPERREFCIDVSERVKCRIHHINS